MLLQEEGLGWLLGDAINQQYQGGGTLTLILFPELDDSTREIAESRLRGFKNGLNGSNWSLTTLDPLDAVQADELRPRISDVGLGPDAFAQLLRERTGNGPVASLISISSLTGQELSSVPDLYMISYMIDYVSWVETAPAGTRITVASVKKTAAPGTDFESMKPAAWAETYGSRQIFP